MVSINLLPKEIVAQQQMKKLTLLVGAVVVLVAVVTMVFWGMRKSQELQLQNEINQLNVDLHRLQDVVNQVKQLTTQKQNLDARKQLVERLLNSGLVYPKFMTDIMKLIPDGVWLTSMNTTVTRGPNKLITQIRVTLNCSSYDKIVIADFLSNLENSSNIAGKVMNPQLGIINVSQQKNFEQHSFSVTFDYMVPN
jgi:Tfp pilus assembly protein PilN